MSLTIAQNDAKKEMHTALSIYKAALENCKDDPAHIEKTAQVLAKTMAQEAKERGPHSWAETYAYTYEHEYPNVYKLYKEECRKILSPNELDALEAVTNRVKALDNAHQQKKSVIVTRTEPSVKYEGRLSDTNPNQNHTIG